MECPDSRGYAENKQVIQEVLSTVSEAEDSDSTQLTPPLYDVIDTDALGDIVRSANGRVEVTFGYREWLVTVQSEDSIQVTLDFDDG